MKLIPKTRLPRALALTALMISGAPLSFGNETIILRSGQVGGVPGAPSDTADNTTYRPGSNPYRVNPILSVPFDSTHFAAARSGPGSRVTAPDSGWKASLDDDPSARWINYTSSPSVCAALHCMSFEVESTGITSATLELDWLAADQFGDNPGEPNPGGVYINGDSLGSSFSGGSKTAESSATADIASFLVPGTNYIYFYDRDTDDSDSGLIFSGRISIVGAGGDDVFEENDTCPQATTLTAGEYDDLVVALGDDDWYCVQVADGATFQASTAFDNDEGNIELSLFAGDCATQVGFSWTDEDVESVTWANTSGATVTVYLQVHVYFARPTGTCNTYDLVIGSNSCPGTEDSFEENDGLNQPYPLGNGVYSDLYLSVSDPDWFQFLIEPGATLEIEASFAHQNGDIDIELWSNPTPLVGSFTADNMESISYQNTTSGLQIVQLQVFLFSAFPSPCNTYQLEVSGAAAGPAPSQVTGDIFQINGLSTGSAWCMQVVLDGVPGPPTVMPPLPIGSTGADFVDQIFGADGDGAFLGTGITRQRVSAECFKLRKSSATGPPSIQLRFGDGSCSDLEEATSASDVNFNPTVGYANPIGGPYCESNPNSTGVRGELRAFGSQVASDNNLILDAYNLPTGAAAYYIASNTQGFVANPGGSDGNLCLGGQIQRVIPSLASSGTSGTLTWQINTANVDSFGTATPGLDVIQAGETWSFQAWHRDLNPTPGSNFTNALFVPF